MNTPVREGETIEGSRTMRNRPYPVSSAQGTPTYKEISPFSRSLNTRVPATRGPPPSLPDVLVYLMVFGIGSLSGGFVKLNALFPPIIAVAAASLRWFVASSASEMVLAALPVPVEKVPFLVAASLPALIFISGLLPIMGLAAAKPDGYDNRHPRLMKTAESLMPKYPLNFRLQSAHNNTIEMVAMAAPAFFVAHALGLNQLLFAKLSVLLLLVRLVYIPLYALDSDAARTTAFVMGAFSIFSIGFGAIFPSTVLTLFGIAAQA